MTVEAQRDGRGRPEGELGDDGSPVGAGRGPDVLAGDPDLAGIRRILRGAVEVTHPARCRLGATTRPKQDGGDEGIGRVRGQPPGRPDADELGGRRGVEHDDQIAGAVQARRRIEVVPGRRAERDVLLQAARVGRDLDQAKTASRRAIAARHARLVAPDPERAALPDGGDHAVVVEGQPDGRSRLLDDDIGIGIGGGWGRHEPGSDGDAERVLGHGAHAGHAVDADHDDAVAARDRAVVRRHVERARARERPRRLDAVAREIGRDAGSPDR